MGIKKVSYYEAPICDLCGASLYILEKDAKEKNYKSLKDVYENTRRFGWKVIDTKCTCLSCVCSRCFKKLCEDEHLVLTDKY